MLYPLTFRPIFKERIWGGRKLEELYHKPLPNSVPIGESWEISDRPGDESVIASGPLAGRDLRWLMRENRADLLGRTPAPKGRFPLLVKILDARQTLSLQVHPPAHKATQLGGDAKTEMWYVAEAAPKAELCLGLRRGVTRQQFEERIRNGTVAECFHRIDVRSGDAAFLPSGRVHALGAGLVVFEIQQNSDTTYRVFDWNRVGLDGRPRDLHIEQSLASIDFDDFEPSVVAGGFTGAGPVEVRSLVQDSLFDVEVTRIDAGSGLTLNAGRMQILGVLTGGVEICSVQERLGLEAGQFCLVPASLAQVRLEARSETTYLRVDAKM